MNAAFSLSNASAANRYMLLMRINALMPANDSINLDLVGVLDAMDLNEIFTDHENSHYAGKLDVLRSTQHAGNSTCEVEVKSPRR